MSRVIMSNYSSHRVIVATITGYYRIHIPAVAVRALAVNDVIDRQL